MRTVTQDAITLRFNESQIAELFPSEAFPMLTGQTKALGSTAHAKIGKQCHDIGVSVSGSRFLEINVEVTQQNGPQTSLSCHCMFNMHQHTSILFTWRCVCSSNQEPLMPSLQLAADNIGSEGSFAFQRPVWLVLP